MANHMHLRKYIICSKKLLLYYLYFSPLEANITLCEDLPYVNARSLELRYGIQQNQIAGKFCTLILYLEINVYQ